MDIQGNSPSRRILVYRIGQLGDTIIALPAMWAIRKHFTRSHLALLSDSHQAGGYVSARSVLPARGLFDQWLTYSAGHHGTSLEVTVSLLRELRRYRFDTLVYLAPRRRTAFRVRRDLLFFRLAGIRKFLGVKGFSSYSERTPGKPLAVLEHEADRLLRRLSLDGVPVPPPGHGEMSLALTSEEQKEAEEWLSEKCGEAFSQRRLVGIGPGSKWLSKVWPFERFAELGKRLREELQLHPVVFGGSEDRELADELVTRWGGGTNAAGALNVRQAAAALAKCRFYVGNDTGTMHLAASVGTPCTAVFSAQDYPGCWYPYGEGHVVLREQVPCEGCALEVCSRDMECLKAIDVAKVFAACAGLNLN